LGLSGGSRAPLQVILQNLETPMSRFANMRPAYAALLAVTLWTTNANAFVRDDAEGSGRRTSGPGVPAWVVRECRPWTGAEILARSAGPGEWFYRGSGDFCWLDTRPGVM
jgi:hypothetical protein